MDYIFFFYGLSFLVLAAVCFFLKKEADEVPAWSWLGLFGLAHGLNEWLDMIAFTFADNLFFSVVRTAVMALSFVFLFEFGRRSLRNSGAKTPGPWLYAPLLLLALLGGCYGLNGLNASARYALGLTAGLLSSLAIYRAAAGKPAGLRGPLLAISAGLGLYAFASGAVAPESALIPARWLNYAAFVRGFGFPVQLLRGLLALFIALSAWIYLLRLGADEGSLLKRKGVFGGGVIAAILISIVAGWGITDGLGNRARAELVRDSENLEMILANRLKDSMLASEQTAVALSGSPLIPAALAIGGPALANANSALDRYCESFDLSVCYLINLKGVTIASSNRKMANSFVGKDYGFRPYFKDAAAGRPGYYFALGVTTGERGFYASAPVKTSGGAVAGVAVVKKNLDPLAKELRLFPYAFLVSPDGIIFLSSRVDMLFRSLWPVPAPIQQDLVKSNQFGRLNFGPVFKAELHDDDSLDFSGNKFYVSRSAFKQGGWSLITFNSLHPVHMARFTGILLTFALCVLLLAFFISLVESETARETVENLLLLKEEVKTLSGLLPICAGCKNIRDDQGKWTKVETYVARHTEAKFSHGLCPDCAKRLYPQYADDVEKRDGGKP